MEGGAGTGWTVLIMDMQSLSFYIIYIWLDLKTSLDAETSLYFFMRYINSWILTYFYYEVRKPKLQGLSAWIRHYYITYLKSNPSETICEEFLSRRYIKQKSDIHGEQWLVGVTDGDGTFHFSSDKNNKWSLYFKITQSSYNLRMLYHIKSVLGVGKVVISSDGMADYRLRDVKNIIKYLLPIFDKYPLLTSKYYNYELFKQAAFILNNKSLSSSDRHKLLSELKSRIRPENYISPVWFKINTNNISLEEANYVVSKSWIIGFTEAEGSFYLVNKSVGRIVHGFEITQKLDKIVLDAIGLILGIPVVKKKLYYTVVTTNSKSILNIILYYTNTMKGMKSLEFRIWARSFNKDKSGQERFEYLTKVRDQMRKIRSIRLDKNFKLIRPVNKNRWENLKNYNNTIP